jgi:hypothetical protein
MVLHWSTMLGSTKYIPVSLYVCLLPIVLPVQSAASAASASSTRRLMAASGLPQDLASALLSKMQGAGPTPPAAAAGGYDAPSPATTVTYASLAALQEPAAVQSSQRVSQDAGASSELSRSARVSPRGAAVAAPVPSTIGASAVADPDYLAFDFEDLGADGDSFAAESEADVAQQPTSGSSSSSSGARSRAVGSQRRADSPSSAIKSTSSSQGQGQGQDQAELQSLSNAAPAASPAAATNALPEAAQPQAAVSSPSLPPKPLAQIQSSSSPGPSSSQATLQVMRTGFREAGSSGDAAAAVCGIQQFSPSGLQQVAEALLCPAPHLSLYSQGGGVFRPVVIPVVFHCEWLGCLSPAAVFQKTVWLLCNVLTAALREQQDRHVCLCAMARMSTIAFSPVQLNLSHTLMPAASCFCRACARPRFHTRLGF